MNAIRGKYYSTDIVYPVEFPKVIQPKIKEAFKWIEDHCYPNVFAYQGYPTEGPDRKVGELIFEEDVKPDDLISILISLDHQMTKNASESIPF